MRKSLSATLLLALFCLFAAACQTTPPAAKPQPPAKPTQQAQAQGPAAAQQKESAPQKAQPVAQEQPFAAQSPQQSVQPETPSSQRPGRKGTAAGELTRLGSSVSSGVGGLIRKVEAVLGIKPGPARRPALAAGVRGARPVLPDLVAVFVTGALILIGSALTLAAIIAGRRRS